MCCTVGRSRTRIAGWRILDTMQQVMRQPRAGVPFKRAGHYFVSRNDGSQNQDVTYVASSLAELLAGG
ncbi:MAG: prolyl oligopeptidase family serine peptidase, partial [Propionibacteriaceae bacterium]|nr:prolyl oligopeptidase family serine peptidase [Propionibacteriaceae bacterium]